jgi:hypothetical protein
MNYRSQYLARPNGMTKCVFMLHTVLRVASLHWFEIVSRLSENVMMLNATNFYGGMTRETYQEVPLITFHH